MDIQFEAPNIDVKRDLSDQHQKLFSIYKVQNKFFIEGV